tara:strand:- start:1713 stop:2093 length:381 start_codon:yes stop_codon:yes gene_type:complete
MNKIKVFITILLAFNIYFLDLSSEEKINNQIYKNLRCIVCQGQSIADSNSDFAQTIKSVVNDKLSEGMNEKEVYHFLSEKYGDWILFDPPVKKKTYLLWSLPYIFFVIGGIAILFIFKKVLKHKKY